MATQDLSTFASYQQYAATQGAAATAQQALIEDTITVASDAIIDYCQVDFAPAVASEARNFRYDGAGILSLAPYVLRTISSVQIDTDTDDPTTLESTSYKLAPIPAKRGVYHTLHLYNTPVVRALSEAAPEYRQVTVTGAWGYASVPLPVRRACNITVGYLMRTGSQHQGDEIDGVTVGWGGSGILIPGNAKRLLAPYRHYSIGG